MPPKQLTNERIKRWERDIMMPPPQRWWVAELADTIIGFAGICPSRDPIDPDLGELNTIAVDPVWWRNGVGQALMSTAIRYLHTDGYSEAVLWTLANYERGQRFYESVGWSLDGGVRDQGRQVRYRLKLRKIITNPKTR